MRNRYENGTRLSERKYRQILRLFAADIPAIKVAQLCAVNYRITHRLLSLWRDRIVRLTLEEMLPFAGEIEVDESYFGARRVRGKRGRGASGKTPVLACTKEAREFISVWLKTAQNKS